MRIGGLYKLTVELYTTLCALCLIYLGVEALDFREPAMSKVFPDQFSIRRLHGRRPRKLAWQI